MYFLAEYEFKFQYRRNISNAAADYLPRTSTARFSLLSEADEGDPIALKHFVFTEEETPLEPFVLDVARHLKGLKIQLEDEDKHSSVKFLFKYFMIWEGNLFKSTKNGFKPVHFMKGRVAILTTFHREVFHCNREATRKLFMDRF